MAEPNQHASHEWQRVKTVFFDAVDRPFSERAAFLDEACDGDERLRREVESLLSSDDRASGFIETPASAVLGPSPVGSPVLTAGDVLGPYRVLGFVGAGGMSHVYLALDTRLGRTVAIKIVANDDGDSAARRRLRREAQHASILSHPHICTIHEVGDAAGVPFIVMEHIDGRPLNELLKAGPLHVQDVRRFGLQIADALDHAHRHGIVHRDLKSSNVVIRSDGRATVLDFGLSTRLPLDGATGSVSFVAGTASLAGTLSHMAPELLQGRSASPQTDVWALGVLLYEMVTGVLPFRGDTPFETSNAILHSDPAAFAAPVPLWLQAVIQGCLTKDLKRRFGSAADVHAALQAPHRRRTVATVLLLLGRYRRPIMASTAALTVTATLLLIVARQPDPHAPPAAPSIRTLAVLPLQNASSDSAEEYFADGLTESLITAMGKVDGVRVLSRTTVMSYRGSGKSSDAIGRELGADVVMEGSVEHAGERFRLRTHLLRSATGQVLWSQTFDRSLRDVLGVQHDIVRAVAQQGQLSMTTDARTRLSASRAIDPEVYEAYLKGRYYWNKRTELTLKTAIGYFNKAVALDATYAPPYLALADCYNQLGTQRLGTGSPQQWRPQALRLTVQALQIDPDFAEAHATLGYIRHYNWDWDQAERDFKRAIELNPSYALAHIWYANFLSSRRRTDEAVREVLLGRDLDPLSSIVNANVGWVLNMAGRYDEAMRQLRRTLELDPAYLHARWRLADAYLGLGRFREAIGELQTVVAQTGRSASALTALANMYAVAGMHNEARRVLDDVLALAHQRYVPPGGIATVYMTLGESERVFPWLDKAFEERSNYIAYLAINRQPQAVRADPRFKQLLRRAGLPED